MTDERPPVPDTRVLTPSWLPAFNLKVTNRIQGIWAPYLPPYAVVVHTGRRSGRRYETPVVAFPHGRTIAIPLPYGSRAQWVQNLVAQDGGALTRRGATVPLSRPRVVTDAQSEPLPRLAARLTRRMGVLVADLG